MKENSVVVLCLYLYMFTYTIIYIEVLKSALKYYWTLLVAQLHGCVWFLEGDFGLSSVGRRSCVRARACRGVVGDVLNELSVRGRPVLKVAASLCLSHTHSVRRSVGPSVCLSVVVRHNTCEYHHHIKPAALCLHGYFMCIFLLLEVPVLLQPSVYHCCHCRESVCVCARALPDLGQGKIIETDHNAQHGNKVSVAPAHRLALLSVGLS